MLSLLLAWLVLIGPVLVGGYRLFLAVAPAGEDDDAATFAAIWLGLLALCNILLLVALAGPVSPLRFAGVLAAITAVGLLHAPTRAKISALLRHVFRWHGRVTVGCLAGVLIAAFAAATPVYFYDTGLYHYPHIAWLAQQGQVHGLALLHDRFGLASPWLTIPAGFDHGFLQGRMSSVFNGFAFALLVVQIVTAIGRLRPGPDGRADRFFVGAGSLSAACLLSMGLVNSASPDVPNCILPAVVAWLILRSRQPRMPAVCALMALLLLTTKLSALPLPVLTGALVVRWQSISSIAKWGLTATIVLAPLVLSSLVTTGCLMFPIAPTCLDVSWSIGAEEARNLAAIIIEWTRWAGERPADASVSAWWSQWGGWRSNQLLLLLLVLSCVAAWGLCREIRGDRKVAVVAAVALLGAAYVLALAPQLRFAIGYLILLPALWAATRDGTWRLRALGWNSGTAAAVLLLLLAPAFWINISHARNSYLAADVPRRTSFLWALLTPPHFVSVRTRAARGGNVDPALYVEEGHGGLVFRRPKAGDQCWDIPLPCTCWDIALPCTPDPPAASLVLRDPAAGLSGGFKRRMGPATPR